MPVLTVRRLLIDLETPLPRHWCGGAFRTAFYNALSMSFPAGEQLFIDSMRKAMAALPPQRGVAFADEVQAFIGQEATHRRIHQRFNEQLARHGLRNTWEPRILARRPLLESLDLRNWLAVTAATEHLTAIFAQHLLTHASALQGAEPRLRDLWLWHSSEEAEHRSTAFNLYVACGGAPAWRIGIFKVVTRQFIVDTLRQTLANLWVDGSCWRVGTWADAARFLFGREGLIRCTRSAWRDNLRADFHPAQSDGAVAERWLQQHADLAPPVRAAVPG